MGDIGKLALAVDSSRVVEAAKALHDLAAAAERVLKLMTGPLLASLAGMNEAARYSGETMRKMFDAIEAEAGNRGSKFPSE